MLHMLGFPGYYTIFQGLIRGVLKPTYHDYNETLMLKCSLVRTHSFIRKKIMSLYKVPSPEEDARVVFEVLKRGGIAIIPMSVGYGITAINPDALDRIFRTKRREPHKRHALVGSYVLHQDIHVLPPPGSWYGQTLDRGLGTSSGDRCAISP